MIPWSSVLNSQDIEDIVAHLRALSEGPPPVPPTPAEGEMPEATSTPAKSTEVAEPTRTGTPAPVTEADPARGGQIFAESCASCHGAGAAGTDVGPSLIADEVVTKDDDALWEIIVHGVTDTMMVPYGGVLSSQDIEDVIAYLRAVAGGPTPAPPTPVETEVPPATSTPVESTGVAEPTPTEPRVELEPTPSGTVSAGDPVIGQALFSGEDQLQRGGAPCLACHGVAGAALPGGRTLGPDLTLTGDKYGDAGLTALMANLNFPTMKPIYQDRPLTPQEQAHLTAFLQAAPTQQPTRPTRRVEPLAIGGAVVLMALAAVVWRRRLFGIRRSLVQKG
jgi:mono/diheme cytochrome c family protein